MHSNYKLLIAYKPTSDYNTVKLKVAQHIAICKKYGVNAGFNEDEMAATYIRAQKAGWLSIEEINLGNDYYKEELRIAFNNLFDAKFGKLFIWNKDFLWGMFYLSFSVSLLLLLFKLTYWRQYLITAIASALYPLFAFIISQILFGSSRSETVFQWFIFILFGFSIVSLFITSKNKFEFKPFFNILNVLFFVLAIYMPMLIVSFLRRNTELFEYSRFSYNGGYPNASTQVNLNGEQIQVFDYTYYLDQYLYSYWQDQYDFWFMLCKIIPIILFLICLPFMKKIFVKQLALPKRA